MMKGYNVIAPLIGLGHQDFNLVNGVPMVCGITMAHGVLTKTSLLRDK